MFTYQNCEPGFNFPRNYTGESGEKQILKSVLIYVNLLSCCDAGSEHHCEAFRESEQTRDVITYPIQKATTIL